MQSLAKPDAATPRRDREPLARRVLILGLDGATWDVLHPMIDAGRMPRLGEFLRSGASGILRSTIPPITPAAWTTCMTGLTPGTHGIFDFERYDVHSHLLSFNTTRCLDRVRTMWHLLGDRGFRVGCVSIPMTYPPVPLNGFLVSGFETPSVDTAFTYPVDLKDAILRKFPEFTFKTKWRRRATSGGDVFAENLEYMKRNFRQQAELTEFCGDRYGWDVLMVVFKLVDNLQHKTWRYLDPRWRDRDPRRAEMTADCFNVLDEQVGRLLDYAKKNDAHVLCVSDHGHGSLEGKVQPNLMLQRWGYLGVKGPISRARTRVRHQVQRWTKRRVGKFAAGSNTLEDDLAVDFSRTRAAVMHAGMCGFLYLNLKGRQPGGIVDPADYEPLRDELRDRFLAETAHDPAGNVLPVFPQVYKPEALYHCTRDGREWLPDLLLMPAEALAVVRKIRGRAPVQWLPPNKIEGTHRIDGIIAAGGPGIAARSDISSEILQVAPTVLAMLGVNVPDDMEGNVAQELFDQSIATETETVAANADATTHSDSEDVYSDEEQRQLTERLRDLGYLE